MILQNNILLDLLRIYLHCNSDLILEPTRVYFNFNRTYCFSFPQKILNSPKKLFDVLIVDLVLYTFECFLPIAEKLNIPVIGTVCTKSWRNTESIMGNPYNPAVVPFDLSYYSNKMTFVQRLRNTIDYLLDVAFHKYVIYPKLEMLYQKYFPNTTVAGRKKPSLLFLNSNPVLTPRPLVPNVINVGGIHMQPVKPLPDVSIMLYM